MDPYAPERSGFFGGRVDTLSSGLGYSWTPWNLSFRYILFHEKKTQNDAVTPQRQSQFTPKMKANAIPRLLSSVVWIDQYNECNGMTSFMEFMLGLLSHSCHVHIYTSFLRRPPILTTQAARQDWIELEAIHVDLKANQNVDQPITHPLRTALLAQLLIAQYFRARSTIYYKTVSPQRQRAYLLRCKDGCERNTQQVAWCTLVKPTAYKLHTDSYQVF